MIGLSMDKYYINPITSISSSKYVSQQHSLSLNYQKKKFKSHRKKKRRRNCKRVFPSNATLPTIPFNSNSDNSLIIKSQKSNSIVPLNKLAFARQQKDSTIDFSQSITRTRRINKPYYYSKNHKICPCCSKFCFLISVPLITLLLIGLSALFVAVATMNKRTTTTITTTTSSTSTTTTSSTSTSTTSTTTTVTTTTSTTSTSTTTSSTSTSTSTTSTTSVTTTSTTSVTTTTVTTTTTETTTSSSTTSSSTISSSTTSLSTSTTTTTTTTANPCGIPTPIGTASAIYSATTGPSSYHCHYFAWTASTTGNVTLAFQFENDPDQWNMDDVSVTDGTHALLLNGGFESGSFSPGWQISEPNGACSWSTTGASIVRSSCRTGNYCFSDGCGSVSDELSQSFLVTAGQVYYISFWLKQGGGSQSGISVDVTLS